MHIGAAGPIRVFMPDSWMAWLRRMESVRCLWDTPRSCSNQTRSRAGLDGHGNVYRALIPTDWMISSLNVSRSAYG